MKFSDEVKKVASKIGDKIEAAYLKETFEDAEALVPMLKVIEDRQKYIDAEMRKALSPEETAFRGGVASRVANMHGGEIPEEMQHFLAPDGPKSHAEKVRSEQEQNAKKGIFKA
jgi:hypothetical protein